MRDKIILLCVAFLAFNIEVLAASIEVEGLQMPVSVERGNSRFPLSLNTKLLSGDIIHTGEGARVLLRLQEGSLVKLGENADFNIASLIPPEDESGIYEATLDVIKGAFRFTTSLIGKYRRRNVTARINTVTIGIRGTDVWGKAELDRDFVVLLEGNISIERDGVSLEMDQVLSLFMAPRGQAALPVAPVDPDDLARWAQETELQSGEGVIIDGGKWQILLASYRDMSIADIKLQILEKAGYAAQRESIDIDGVTWTRITLDGFESVTDASNLATKLKNIYNFSSPWVRKLRIQ